MDEATASIDMETVSYIYNFSPDILKNMSLLYILLY